MAKVWGPRLGWPHKSVGARYRAGKSDWQRFSSINTNVLLYRPNAKSKNFGSFYTALLLVACTF